jgi:hypothetical protein
VPRWLDDGLLDRHPSPDDVVVVWCETCGMNPAKYRDPDECSTCGEYRRRTGRVRPEALVQRQADLNWMNHERKLAAEMRARLTR